MARSGKSKPKKIRKIYGISTSRIAPYHHLAGTWRAFTGLADVDAAREAYEKMNVTDEQIARWIRERAGSPVTEEEERMYALQRKLEELEAGFQSGLAQTGQLKPVSASPAGVELTVVPSQDAMLGSLITPVPAEDIRARVEQRIKEYMDAYDAQGPNDIASIRTLAVMEVRMELLGDQLVALSGRTEPTVISLTTSISEALKSLSAEHRQLQKTMGIMRSEREQGDATGLSLVRSLIEETQSLLERELLEVTHCGILLGVIWFGFPTRPFKVYLQCPRCEQYLTLTLMSKVTDLGSGGGLVAEPDGICWHVETTPPPEPAGTEVRHIVNQ